MSFLTASNSGVRATGGTTVTTFTDNNDIEYQIHTFENVGTDTFTVESSGEIDVLIVAGGGGGGTMDSGSGAAGGGGGAGGLIFDSIQVDNGNYSIIVGAGGSNRVSNTENIFAENGEDSSAFGFTAIGGGGAGTRDFPGQDGGSGGGSNNGLSAFGTGVTGQGNRGGGGENNSSPSAGGGGGGAAEPGEDAKTDTFTTDIAGAGGDGIDFSDTFGKLHGEEGVFAGGGGGGNGRFPQEGIGGLGGGGDGGNSTSGSTSRQKPGNDALPNTGGGGGGDAGSPGSGSSGGSGIVIIRYEI